ncbi:MAG TPA: PIG-L family deacetylase, partial [Longimicrobiales bacterium]|nr:PIG-L family deacetylase [Longimicrobiales bacterium]
MLATPPPLRAQVPLRGVLARTNDAGSHGPLAMDEGATGAWQKLLKVGITASVLYTTAHPDDEEPGVLTLLSRGMGARTALLTLNRGEGGANAIGPELFDALGLIRTEELRLAGRHYGLDDQYFTTAADYGYSKTLGEAMRSWDREAVLADMVRVIRTNRPLVVISRWHGSERDGHGHHQAAGALTPEAVAAAADPARFPEQIAREGLRPWRPRKVYRGRIRDGETWHLELDPGVPSPWLGRSYQEVGAEGLALQRSQTSGRSRPFTGAARARYERLVPSDGPAREDALFDGLDTSLPGIFDLLGEAAPPGAVEALRDVDARVREARDAFRMDDPGAAAPALAAALAGLRAVLARLPRDSEARFHLVVEERQMVDALAALVGLRA